MIYLGSQVVSTIPTDWQQRFAELACDATDPLLRAYYQAGQVSAKTPLHQVPLLALDLETTGLNPAEHGIVSIGLVPLSAGRIQLSAAKQWFVRPRYALTASSVRVHQITDSVVAAAPDFAEILPEFLQAIAGKVLVVHCADIERQFLAAACRTRLGQGIIFPVIDTMVLEARLHRAKPLSLWQRWRGIQPVSIRLAASRARYGLPPYRPHHAVTDALASAELLQAQVAHRYDWQDPLAHFLS